MKIWTINKVLFGIVLFLLGLLAFSDVGQAVPSITLTSSNHILFAGKVNNKLVSQTIDKLMKVKNKNIYMYIISPGGDLFSGSKLIDFLKSTDKKVICIADFAASMAFTALQHCHKRYVMESSILMQHEASIRLNDSMSKFQSMLKMIRSLIYYTELSTAKYMGLSYKAYRRKIQHDWWINGPRAKQENAADKLIAVKCSKKLMNSTYTETISSGFNRVTVTWSKCPVISYPVAIHGDKQLFHHSIKLNRNNWSTTTIKQINIPFLNKDI